jgi:predicted transcriptional regulator
METPERAVALVSEGLAPAQIAAELNIPTAAVIQHLSAAVNEGRLRRSDVLFTLSKELRDTVELCAGRLKAKHLPKIRDILKLGFELDADPEEVKLYLAYREGRVQMGDMYEILSELERTMHAKIKSVLVKQFGREETGWWRQGVPEGVRVDCAKSRESDADFYEHPYGYTTVIHLREILDKRWRLFVSRLPEDVAKDKQALFEDLRCLNCIRNRVMHPIRGDPPSEDDFEFVKAMHRKLHVSRWR